MPTTMLIFNKITEIDKEFMKWLKFQIRLYRDICLVVIANKTRAIFNLALQLFQAWLSTYE